MEDAKLQALHDTLSKLRPSGHKGLGSKTQYSWQRQFGEKPQQERHPAAASLPNNALYAKFVPEGTYDPTAVNDGDGRAIKRDFSDTNKVADSANSSSASVTSSARKRRKKERKEEKKEAAKVAKLEAKRQAKIEEKKRVKREAKKRKKEESSPMVMQPTKNDAVVVAIGDAVDEKKKRKRKLEGESGDACETSNSVGCDGDKKNASRDKMKKEKCQESEQPAGESTTPAEKKAKKKKKKKKENSKAT
jgi:hypothetical protein